MARNRENYKLTFDFWNGAPNAIYESDFVRNLGPAPEKRYQLLKFSSVVVGAAKGLPQYYVRKTHLGRFKGAVAIPGNLDLYNLSLVDGFPIDAAWNRARFTALPAAGVTGNWAPNPATQHSVTLWPYYEGGNIAEFKRKFIQSRRAIPDLVVVWFIEQAFSTLWHFYQGAGLLVSLNLDKDSAFLVSWDYGTNEINFNMANFESAISWNDVLANNINTNGRSHEDFIRSDIAHIVARARSLLYRMNGPHIDSTMTPAAIIAGSPRLTQLFGLMQTAATAPPAAAGEDIEKALEDVMQNATTLKGLLAPGFNLKLHFDNHISDLRDGGGNTMFFSNKYEARKSTPTTGNWTLKTLA